MGITKTELEARARRVRLLLLDVDGVLTDGRILIDDRGGEAKAFSIRDGAAIVWARREGIEVGFLSGRPSGATTRRAAELGVTLVAQVGPDKRQALGKLLTTAGVQDDEVAYMGDDLMDLAVFARVGLSASPADAAPEVQARADWVSGAAGGHGAVRELIEVLLKARGRWDAFIDEQSA